jgi:hypothetical protein
VVVSFVHSDGPHMRRQTPDDFYWDIAADRQTPELQERMARENAPSIVLRQVALALLVPLVLAVVVDLFVR